VFTSLLERSFAITAKLFIGNLNYATTQDELSTLFSECGALSDVFLPIDRQTGRPRGFAFIEFEDGSAATEAVEKFDGFELKGRKIRVSEAQERVRRPPSVPRNFDDAPDFSFGKEGKAKGSRRNLRARKRSL